MNENKILNFIQKANIIILFIVGILSFLILCVILYFFINEKISTRHINNVVNIENKNVKENFTYQNSINIKKTPYLMLPLSLTQKYRHAYYSKSTENSVKNYLFIDVDTGYNFWLLPTNKYLILDYDFVYDDKKEIKAIIYKIIKKDTNKDNRLTCNDKITLSISKVDGSDYKELAQDVNEYLGYKLVKDKLVILYAKTKASYSLHVNLDEFAATIEISLAKIKD